MAGFQDLTLRCTSRPEKMAAGHQFITKVVISIIIIIIITTTIIIIVIIAIINTRPMPAYGRQGLAGVSLRASGAQLGRGK